MKMISKEELKARREEYPVGTRIELIEMGEDPYSKLKPGDQGVITAIDDAGSLFCEWDCGSSLGLIYQVDRYKKVED